MNSTSTLSLLLAERERRRRSGRVTLSPEFRAFQTTYRADPVAMVHDCFIWKDGKKDGPAFYQENALAALPVRKRVSVRGPHGLGKTALAAWAVLWFGLTREGDDWKVPTTASAWRQLNKFLWPEIHKWVRRLRWNKIGRQPFDQRSELLDLSLKLGTGEAFALASDTPELMEGAHAECLLYLLDESKIIPNPTWDAVEGAFSGPEAAGEALALAVSTPGEPSGRFFDIQSHKSGFEDWHSIAVSLDDAIRAGRIGKPWAEQRRKQWGEGSAVYQNRVLGNFAASDEDGVIPLSWVEAANERWLAWVEAGKPGTFKCVGVDVARGGEDSTVRAPRYEYTEEGRDGRRQIIIAELLRTSKQDTMATTGHVVGMLRNGGYAVVDVIGIGAGVVDRGREQELDFRPFNASEKTDRLDRTGELGFTNLRSAAWWNAREMLDPDNGFAVALPPDDRLTGDLTTPHWRVMSGGKIQIESKDDAFPDAAGKKGPTLRERLDRSPDDGDAVVMALWEDEPLQLFLGAVKAKEK